MASGSYSSAVAAGIWLLLSLSFLLTVSTAFQHQTLKVTTLPEAPSLDESLFAVDTEVLDATSYPGSVSFGLHHVDALSFNSTPVELFESRLRRDSFRVSAISTVVSNRLTGFSSSIVSGLSHGSGEYFTRLGVGTPARYVYMVLDTGSDVVWVQCAPCKKCYTQADPVFNPAASSTFSGIQCGSPVCRSLDSAGCDTKRQLCLYEVSYGDGSFTFGEFSTETLTFRGTRVPGVALGCGHDNEGLFVGAAGLLGLGRGRLSFPGQTGNRFNGRFSYCLADRSSSSRPSSMIFGNGAVSRKARFTPLLSNPKLDTFYYVQLVGVSVGGSSVSGINPSLFKFDEMGNGGVIIDSGTSVTRLTDPAYSALRNAFLAGATHLKRTSSYSLFDTCFDLSGKTEVKVPTIVLHFQGADLPLPASNYLIPVNSKGSFCFAFAATTSGLSIIGNIQQQGFRVIYDLSSYRVGFASGSCT